MLNNAEGGPTLKEKYFVSSFRSELNKELRPMLKLLKPRNLNQGFEQALVKEHAVEVMNRKIKLTQRYLPVTPQKQP